MLWLYLHFPQLQLDSLLQAQHNEKPPTVVIVDGQQHQVCQLNQQALDSGIKLGMRLSSAILLNPELSVVQYQSRTEHTRIEQLAQQLYQHIACINLRPPQGILLEIGSMLKLYKGLIPLWKKLQGWCQVQQLEVRGSCGFQPLTAQLLAQANQGIISQEPERIDKHLSALLVPQLGLTPVVEKKLLRMGIRDLQQLQTLKRSELGKRFGLGLLRHLDKMSGQLAEPQQFYTPPPGFQHHVDFLHEVYHCNGLRFPLNRILQDFCHFLQQNQLVSEYLELHLHYRDSPVSIVKISQAQGEDHIQQFRQLIELRLERLQLSEPAIAMSFKAPLLSPKDVAHKDLFARHHSTMTAHQLIGRLQAKCGAEQVSRIHLKPEHRPEKAFNYTSAHASHHEPKHLTRNPRPALLFPEPQPLYNLPTLLHGPERIQSGWWDNQPICRDYYHATNHYQQRCWVFRDHRGQWFLHGLFA